MCLGTDPAVTLVSLATHKPVHAWIIYDRLLPAIEELAIRTEQNVKLINSGRTHLDFVPSDLFGRGILAWGRQTSSVLQKCLIDIKPGSKAQSRTLAALAVIIDGELWTLDPRKGLAESLDGGHSVLLSGPPLAMAAAVTGGASTPVRTDRTAFFLLLAEFFLCMIENTGKKDWNLGSVIAQNCQCGGHRSFVRKSGTMRLVEIFHKERSLKVNVNDWKSSQFEEMVAHLFLNCGADEACLNIKWEWPLAYSKELTMATGIKENMQQEVDVAVRFGPYILAVSCKSGTQVKLQQECREIEATTMAGFGRQAIPVIVVLRTDSHLMEKSLKAKKGVVIMDFQSIAAPGSLSEKLRTIFESRYLCTSFIGAKTS